MAKHAPEKGSIVIIAALAAAVFSMIIGGYLTLQTYETKWARKNLMLHIARSAAEAGVDEAVWRLAHSAWTGWDTTSNPYVGPSTQLTAADGSSIAEYQTVIHDPGSAQMTIETVAAAPDFTAPGAVSRTVNAKFSQGSQLFNMGVFADQWLRFTGNAQIDSYNSTSGPYGGLNRFNNGDAGTNGAGSVVVTLSGNAAVKGDVFIGQGGNTVTNISTSGNAVILGSRSTLNAPVPLIQITAPNGLPNRGALNVSSNSSITISSNGQYSSISVSGNARITISGNVKIYVTGAVSISGNGRITIPAGSECELYCGGNVSFSGNGFVNSTQNPHSLKIFGLDSCSSITNSGNGNYYGTLYARNAAISVTGNGEIFGAMVGDTLQDSGNGNIHYDESLGSYIMAQGSYRLKYWTGD